MTPDEFKTWRLAKGLSHQEAADLLGASSRFVVMRWEKGSEMPSTLAARITEAESVLAATPPGERPNARPITGKHDYSAHQCWTLAGAPITFDATQAKPLGFQFYRLDSSRDVDPRTGHQKANLYETVRGHRRGLCSDFALDLVTWRIITLAKEHEPTHVRLAAELNALLKPRTTSAPTQGMFQ